MSPKLLPSVSNLCPVKWISCEVKKSQTAISSLLLIRARCHINQHWIQMSFMWLWLPFSAWIMIGGKVLQMHTQTHLILISLQLNYWALTALYTFHPTECLQVSSGDGSREVWGRQSISKKLRHLQLLHGLLPCFPWLCTRTNPFYKWQPRYRQQLSFEFHQHLVG